MNLESFNHLNNCSLTMTCHRDDVAKYNKIFKEYVRMFFPQEFMLSLATYTYHEDNMVKIVYEYKPLVES